MWHRMQVFFYFTQKPKRFHIFKQLLAGFKPL